MEVITYKGYSPELDVRHVKNAISQETISAINSKIPLLKWNETDHTVHRTHKKMNTKDAESRLGKNKLQYLYFGRDLWKPHTEEVHDVIKEVIKEDYRVYSDSIFVSPVDNRLATPWHTGQNNRFMMTRPRKHYMYTMWVALQDLDETTGGRLMFFNGDLAHKLDQSMNKTLNSEFIVSTIDNILKYDDLDERSFAISVKKGDVLIFTDAIPHAAEEKKIIFERLGYSIRTFHIDEKVSKKRCERAISQNYFTHFAKNGLKQTTWEIVD